MVKTYKNWKYSLNEYLKVGDKVDYEMYEHFLNVLPPLTCTSTMLQVSEPYNHINGKGTYATFEYDGSYWVYRGNCFEGENINRQ